MTAAGALLAADQLSLLARLVPAFAAPLAATLGAVLLVGTLSVLVAAALLLSTLLLPSATASLLLSSLILLSALLLLPAALSLSAPPAPSLAAPVALWLLSATLALLALAAATLLVGLAATTLLAGLAATTLLAVLAAAPLRASLSASLAVLSTALLAVLSAVVAGLLLATLLLALLLAPALLATAALAGSLPSSAALLPAATLLPASVLGGPVLLVSAVSTDVAVLAPVSLSRGALAGLLLADVSGSRRVLRRLLLRRPALLVLRVLLLDAMPLVSAPGAASVRRSVAAILVTHAYLGTPWPVECGPRSARDRQTSLGRTVYARRER